MLLIKKKFNLLKNKTNQEEIIQKIFQKPSWKEKSCNAESTKKILDENKK